MPPLPGMAPPGMPPSGPVIYPPIMPMPPFPPPPRRGRAVGAGDAADHRVGGLAIRECRSTWRCVGGGGGGGPADGASPAREATRSRSCRSTGSLTTTARRRSTLVLKDVEKDSAVRALVVEIDTPGGSATASDEMYHRLDRFKNDKHVPVVIAMRGMATSGGYYVSSAGDYIFAEPGCLTGNIGVLFPRFNLSKLANEYGVYESTLTATTPGHSYKNAGSMFQPANPLDEQYLQGLVDGTFAQFKSVVETGRKGKLSDKEGDIFSGKAFIAADALRAG